MPNCKLFSILYSTRQLKSKHEKFCQEQDLDKSDSNTMRPLKKDILVGGIFIVGIWNFVSGLLVVSTVLFAIALMFSIMFAKSQLDS